MLRWVGHAVAQHAAFLFACGALEQLVVLSFSFSSKTASHFQQLEQLFDFQNSYANVRAINCRQRLVRRACGVLCARRARPHS